MVGVEAIIKKSLSGSSCAEFNFELDELLFCSSGSLFVESWQF